jgi:hypothetical protein
MNFSWKDKMYIQLDKELRNGSYVLTSDLLKKEQKANYIYEYPDLLSFFTAYKSMIGIIIPIIIWLLMLNDGWIISIGLCLIYIASLAITNESQYGGVLPKLSIDFYKSLEPYNNTMKECKYLIERLEQAEQKGGQEGLFMYSQLVLEMNKKYGKGQHLLAPPYNPWKEQREKQELKKQLMKKQIEEWRS